MDGRETVRAGGVRWKNAWVLVLALGAGLSAGCTSDAASICERLYECDRLPEGYSVGKCENDVARDLPDEQQADCSACVERKSCDVVIEECRADCAPR